MLKFITILFVLAFSVSFSAQKPFTEIEQLKIENAKLHVQIAQLTKDLSQWRTSFAQAADALGKLEAAIQDSKTKQLVNELAKEFEKERPGFIFDPASITMKPKPEDKK